MLLVKEPASIFGDVNLEELGAGRSRDISLC